MQDGNSEQDQYTPNYEDGHKHKILDKVSSIDPDGFGDRPEDLAEDGIRWRLLLRAMIYAYRKNPEAYDTLIEMILEISNSRGARNARAIAIMMEADIADRTEQLKAFKSEKGTK